MKGQTFPVNSMRSLNLMNVRFCPFGGLWDYVLWDYVPYDFVHGYRVQFHTLWRYENPMIRCMGQCVFTKLAALRWNSHTCCPKLLKVGYLSFHKDTSFLREREWISRQTNYRSWLYTLFMSIQIFRPHFCWWIYISWLFIVSYLATPVQ
jgi:hypothetical protein